MEFNRKNRRRCYFSKYYFIIFFLFDKISLVIGMKKKIFIVGLIAFLFDQISKLLIINSFSLGESKTIIKSFFSLTYIENFGAAWGMFSNSTILLILISMIFLFFFIKYILELKKVSILSTISF